MLYIKETSGSVDDVCKKIQDACVQNKFGVISVIDLKEKLAAKGVSLSPQCRIIEVCNPGQAKKVLERDMTISSALPCRISIYEESGKIKVVTMKPSAMLNLFGNPELEQVAKDVESTIIRIIETACEK